VLERARAVLGHIDGVARALDELAYLASVSSGAEISVDLADLRGYHYHSGVMFGAYVPGLPNALARGGRYDQVGEAFGRARPATGFSMDLRELARLMPAGKRRPAICAPWNTDASFKQKLAELRAAGEVVIQTLPGHEDDHDEFDCDRVLVCENGNWILKTLG
jgi:ATP phosphoribosyltransferase regulatory subunit